MTTVCPACKRENDDRRDHCNWCGNVLPPVRQKLLATAVAVREYLESTKAICCTKFDIPDSVWVPFCDAIDASNVEVNASERSGDSVERFVRPTPDYKLSFGVTFSKELVRAGYRKEGVCKMDNGKEGVVFCRRPNNSGSLQITDRQITGDEMTTPKSDQPTTPNGAGTEGGSSAQTGSDIFCELIGADMGDDTIELQLPPGMRPSGMAIGETIIIHRHCQNAESEA